jgi:hypothetical protein
MMRVVLVLVVVLSAVAEADRLRDDEPLAAFQLPPPEELASHLDRDAVIARSTMFEHAMLATLHPRARANLQLALGDLWTSYALYEDARFEATQDLDRHIAAEVALDRAKIHYSQLARDKTLLGWPNLEPALAHYAYVLRRKHEPATAPLERLLAEVPASHYAPYAHLAIGDEALWKYAPTAALQHYAAAAEIEFPDRAHALFKQAWIELLTKNHPSEAYALLQRAATASGHEHVADVVRNALVLAFVKADPPDDAFETFARAFPDHAIDMLDGVATEWQHRDDYVRSIAARRELLRRAPGDPRACEWEAAVARLSHAVDDRVGMLASIERLVQRATTARDPECEAEAAQITLANARVFAERTGDPVLAGRLYDLFLRAFPLHEQRAEILLERVRLRARKRKPPRIK